MDPTTFNDLEQLRQHLLEYIDDRLDESEYLQWSHATQPFEFIRSLIVVFDTHINVDKPTEMATYIPDMSVSSVFYHFIDARRRNEDKVDDFRHWLSCFGEIHRPLIERLSTIDPYFMTLTELRQQVSAVFNQYFAGEIG